ncbi:Dyp-type peroxidase [Corynebacterium massiliense]|uniref:Deferrochelatase/peroxidase YfeX n=1 Tax=Corynebacterium massiliense DSM 45435 TaxID=1121364 RepID=A0ABY7U716_9CORY|nr:Dyp-type peroxidase [Corynebacterium massiliense]WCZ32494.1 putative deferrochelatase/peroxidase YfeX [Corynebacterium massiliense DSM 45435]
MSFQHIVDKPSRNAIFLVLKITPGRANDVRAVLDEYKDLVKSVAFRNPEADLFSVLGIGYDAWPLLTSAPRPSLLQPFQEIVGPRHTAPATDGDLLLHLRAEEFDMCHEMARVLLRRFGSAVSILDETHGFKYFDRRDLLGFVDGSANPVSDNAGENVFLPQEADYPGGTYVTVQKYLHDIQAWDELSVESQEDVVGRTKLDNIELPADKKPADSHVAVNENDGRMYRENMVFGSFQDDVTGTYFIGYVRDPERITKRLRKMFAGDPDGKFSHDRILDFSTALTGTNFFVPSVNMMDDFKELPPAH